MGVYINIGNDGFKYALKGEYVDKSGLISIINSTLNSERCYTCVTRCRRFGKSMAVRMLNAYYDKSCDSRELFANLEIAKDPSFEQYLNKYPVINLDMTYFTTTQGDRRYIIEDLTQKLKTDILETYPEVKPKLHDNDELIDILLAIVNMTGEKFIMLIDEWDAICREFLGDHLAMGKYVDWLRQLFKGGKSERVFAGVYMTGILPIKKYKTQSALNNFWQYTMVQPMQLDKYFGFTLEEAKKLCKKYNMDFDEILKWYDGYQIGNQPSMLNPSSVMKALISHECDSYWANTGAFETVSDYIRLNYKGLKDDVISLVAGNRVKVNATKFNNDMSDIKNKDDVLTLLIHLGYLAFDKQKSECYIPNKEVEREMTNAIEDTGWDEVTTLLHNSERLLNATLEGDARTVEQALDEAHDENTSILSYNDENSLSCVVTLAYYYAKNDYIFYREMASGKGFADIVMIPRKNVREKPAIIVELKYDKSADTAIRQIHEKRYTGKVRQFSGDILLVGINYDKEKKTHQCQIEPYKPMG